MKNVLHPLSLSFSGDWTFLEEDYRKDMVSESVSKTRIALLIGASLYAFFGILDMFMEKEMLRAFLFLRYLFIVPGGFVVIILSYRPFFLKYSQIILFAVCLAGGLVISLMIGISHSPLAYTYYIGLILIFITIHSFMQLRFLWAMACTVLIITAYEFVYLTIIKPQLVYRLNTHFFLYSSAFICMASGYFNEMNLRRRYYTQFLLKKEEEKVNSQKEKMEVLGTISSSIAHDFNNMLISMQGYTELSLQETAQDSPSRHYQEEVFRASLRAQAMTEEILSFSRDEQCAFTAVSPHSLFQQVEDYLTPRLPDNIEFYYYKDSTKMIWGDENKLYRLLLNLCTNSLHAMEENGGVLVLSSEERDYRILLRIKDNGPGIEENIRDHIFEPYFTTKKEGKGTGLGLYIVQEMVGKMGGKISLKSSPGEGTEFLIFLPIFIPR
ncbi:MAG: HAMP domain-containing sensor histidine kinase [Spirochaetales bacterium]|nr:HAMP domain-containing sensor histidine kinase [Spirochaetales bacterium]